jgi:hypothetical protein
MALPVILGIIVEGLGLSLVLFARPTRPSLPYPPGPKGEWIFGNARQTPTERQWVAFAQWTEKYGAEITFFFLWLECTHTGLGGYVFLKIFQSPYLVINSPKAAMDLLEKKSNIYSDRPVSTMATEL